MTKPKEVVQTESYIDNAAILAIARHETVMAAIAALEFARGVLVRQGHTDRHLYSESKPEENAWLILRGGLYELAHKARQDAGLFGLLTDNPKIKAAATKVAATFVARHNAEVMQYLDVNGVTPGRYLVDTSDAFRKELDAALAAIAAEAKPKRPARKATTRNTNP